MKSGLALIAVPVMQGAGQREREELLVNILRTKISL